MNNILRSKKGISPILATLLLIVIAVSAVIVTYAWVMTFTGTTTSQAGALLTVENTRFYGDGDNIEIILRNSGTADATVSTVYIGTSSSDLVKQTSGVVFDPVSKIVAVGSIVNISITGTDIWADGQTYYFNIGTEEGINLPFNREA